MSHALNVGIVCHASFGGSGVIAAELALGLERRGHRVHVMAAAKPARLSGHGGGVVFHTVEPAPYPLFDAPPYTLALASTLVEVSRAHALDVIHVHYAVPFAASAALACQALGAAAPRVVTTLHGTDVTRVGIEPSYRTIARATVLASQGITVPSMFLRREVYRLWQVPEATLIEVIPNFVDTDRFAPPAERQRRQLNARLFGDEADSPVLFHVSNFRPLKRVTDLVEMLSLVRRQVPARLALVGDGPERAQVVERTRQLQLEREVALLGPRTDFAALLGHADVFVLPSETESFGLAALEALACGVPVVAYDVGGLSEVLTPEVGRLVRPLDVALLAQAVLEMLAHPGDHDRMGRAARTRAETHFSMAPAIERYEAYFRRVLDEPRRPT